MEGSLANRLIDRISQFTEYNICIMDENGMVIASRPKEIVGMFHEVAYQIIKGDKDIMIVEHGAENFRDNVKEGVIIALFTNKTKIGALGILGDPLEVMPIAKMAKLSAEVMLEFEFYKYENIKKYNLSEQMLHLIFFNDNYKREDIEPYAVAMQLSEKLMRVPILISIKNWAGNEDKVMNIIRSNPMYSRQDLSDLTRDGCIFVLKSIECKIETVMQDYKYIIGEFLSPFLQYARQNNLKYGIYIGPIQDDILYYRQAYLLCEWMNKYIGKTGNFYFYDYIIKYLETMVTLPEFHSIFLVLKKQLGKKFVNNYVELIEVLISTDYNLVKASEIMHIHKNTLVYRLDKIREVLNMNPLVCNADRQFMDCFYFYLKYK